MSTAFPGQDDAPLQIPLSPRVVLRMSGSDRFRFLSGQVTQDVSLATETEAAYACVLNAKGQLDATCHIRAYEDSYLIDAPIELREHLMSRLERYLIADDVEIEDESHHWVVTHLLNYSERPINELSWLTKRLGEQGIDIFSRSELEIEGFPIATEDHYEYLRTFRGIPEWGSELHFGQMPQEAGIENDTISYAKGCYIGQEVISRMKRAGKVPRYLTKFLVPPGTNPPCTIYHNGLPAGEITTVADLLPAESASLALGYRRRKFKDAESFDLQPEAEPSGSFQATVRNL
tara:strand:- start:172 stop:1041 length:870 start_codon:yes stop_codon:yes gene_type:complete